MANNSSAAIFECPVIEHKMEVHYVQVVLYCVIIVISLLGNMAVIAMIYRNKSMRTFTNILICNSACADLLITLLPNIYEILNILIYKGTWALGGFMCVFLHMSTYLSVASTIITLMVVTIDRYLAVMSPYKKHLRVESTPWFILGIWIVAFLFSTPTTFAQKLVQKDGSTFCIEKFPQPLDNEKSQKYYTLILFIFLYVLPLLLMAIMYTIIICKLKRTNISKRSHRNNDKSNSPAKKNAERADELYAASFESEAENKVMSHPLNTQSKISLALSSEENGNEAFHADGGKETETSEKIPLHPLLNKSSFDEKSQGLAQFTKNGKERIHFWVKRKKHMNKGIKSTKDRAIYMLMAVVCSFGICWLPVYVLQFLRFFNEDYICPAAYPRWAPFLAFFLQYANSAFSPMIYFTFSKSYRNGLKKTFYPPRNTK